MPENVRQAGGEPASRHRLLWPGVRLPRHPPPALHRERGGRLQDLSDHVPQRGGSAGGSGQLSAPCCARQRQDTGSNRGFNPF